MYLWEGTHVIGSTIKTAVQTHVHICQFRQCNDGESCCTMVILQALA
jgi:hypothetical protein